MYACSYDHHLTDQPACSEGPASLAAEPWTAVLWIICQVTKPGRGWTTSRDSVMHNAIQEQPLWNTGKGSCMTHTPCMSYWLRAE